MADKWMIFEMADKDQIKAIDASTGEYFGYTYFLEYGNYLKIGMTNQPYRRLANLVRQALSYANCTVGRFAVSPPATNYSKNEKFLHSLFRDRRRSDSELFDISLEDALDKTYASDIRYEDKSAELKRKRDSVGKSLVDFVRGNVQDVSDSPVCENHKMVRTKITDETKWFIARDVCESLGISNDSRFIKNYVRNENKHIFSLIDNMGRKQTALAINIAGILDILFCARVKNERVIKARRWITDEVFPSIERYGGYIGNVDELGEKGVIETALAVANNILDERVCG